MKAKTTILVLALATPLLQAAVTVGSDIASNPAYDSGWTDGTDGGTSATFGAWDLNSTAADAGHFIGDSTILGSPAANINTSGEAFGMFGHSGQTSESIRSFGGNTLGIGQTFSLDLAVNFRNGNKGFDLRDSSNAVLFNFNIGADDYVVDNAATDNESIGNSYSSNTAFALAFTQTAASAGTWTISRSGGVTDFDSGTYNGVPDNFKLYVSGTDNGNAENHMFANNFNVVPEPSAAILGAIGSLILLRRRR